MLVPTAAVLTVGTELVTGLRVDTNSAEVALALEGAGYRVIELVSVGDDLSVISSAIGRLTTDYDTVVVTGGLGPTHDDITREAAAGALGLTLVRDETIAAGLEARAARHVDWKAREQMFKQALVPSGATVVPATVGTAPGLLIPTARGLLALLPGPPREMRSMLSAVVGSLAGARRAAPSVLACALVSESDVQLRAQAALEGVDGVRLGVLAKPGAVHVVLIDEGAGESGLADARAKVREALGDVCYAEDDTPLAETVLRLATARGTSLAAAESCTGGMIAAALTDIAGSSAVFLGGVVSYSNDAKREMLGVSEETLARHGAVSAETAREMAVGCRERFGADLAVSVTGIAGPDGGSADKPVGLVWFGFASSEGVETETRTFWGDRASVRALATAYALDGFRRRLGG